MPSLPKNFHLTGFAMELVIFAVDVIIQSWAIGFGTFAVDHEFVPLAVKFIISFVALVELDTFA